MCVWCMYMCVRVCRTCFSITAIENNNNNNHDGILLFQFESIRYIGSLLLNKNADPIENTLHIIFNRYEVYF